MRTSKYKVKILQADKRLNVFGVPQRKFHGVLRRSFAISFFVNHSVNCLRFEENTRKTYNDNLCLCRDLALQEQKNRRLEEATPKLFELFLGNTESTDLANFQGLCMQLIPVVEEIVQASTFLFDTDFSDGFLIDELARRIVGSGRRSVRKYEEEFEEMLQNSTTVTFRKSYLLGIL